MSNTKALFKQCLSSLIVVTVFAYLSYQVVLIKDDLSQVNWFSAWPLITAALLLCMATQAIQASLWYLLVRTKSPQAVNVKTLLASFFYPIPGKYLPGKMLYAAARIEFIKQSFGIDRKQGGALFMLETLGMLLAASLLSSPYIIQWFWSYLAPMPATIKWIGAIGCGVALVIAVFIIQLPASRKKLQPVLRVFLILPKQSFLTLLASYHLLWISFGLSGLLTVMSLSDPSAFSLTDNLMIMSAFIAAWLIGFLSFLTPGGIGVREATLVLFLSPIIGVEIAALAAIISRILWTLAEFSGVLYCTLLKTPKPTPNC